MSKAQRRAQILTFLSMQTESKLIMEIGKGVGLKSKKYVRELLDQLEADGEVYVTWADHPQYGRSRFYTIVTEE